VSRGLGLRVPDWVRGSLQRKSRLFSWSAKGLTILGEGGRLEKGEVKATQKGSKDCALPQAHNRPAPLFENQQKCVLVRHVHTLGGVVPLSVGALAGEWDCFNLPTPQNVFFCPSGSLSRAGPLPLLRQPPIMQPPLDLKQILPFPLEPAPTLGLFGNYSTVSTATHFPHLPVPGPFSSQPIPVFSSCAFNSSSLLMTPSCLLHWLCGIPLTTIIIDLLGTRQGLL
jgi:hypothetical protein